jgi:cyclopropane-fatty-acyl-phospholipid synthase
MTHDVSSLKTRAQTLLQKAGITLGGQRPTDLVIHDERTYARVFAHGTLGFGEAYMDGWWDVGDLPAFFARVLSSHLDDSVRTLDTLMAHLKARLINRQRGSHAWDVGRRHYDLGNDLFEAMLGKRMVYSCAYWAHADNLDDAQEAKLDLICRKLALRPGQRVLDIGCGWGEALKFAAERYGVSGVGVTVSQEQAVYARELCLDLPVEIRLQDYRELDEPFDAILSTGMFEHVGGKNYRTWFEVARRCLRKDGLAVLHTIGSNGAPGRPDPWIDKYIFPNSVIPSMSQVAEALEGLFVVEDWHNFGADYDRTLMAWRANVEAA